MTPDDLTINTTAAVFGKIFEDNELYNGDFYSDIEQDISFSDGKSLAKLNEAKGISKGEALAFGVTTMTSAFVVMKTPYLKSMFNQQEGVLVVTGIVAIGAAGVSIFSYFSQSSKKDGR